MKFTLDFLQNNQAMFQEIATQDNLDYIAFYHLGDDVYAMAETWEDTHKSTFSIEC